MWYLDILSIVRNIKDNNSSMGFVLILKIFAILFLIIYIFFENKTNKWWRITSFYYIYI